MRTFVIKLQENLHILKKSSTFAEILQGTRV